MFNISIEHYISVLENPIYSKYGIKYTTHE